MTAAGIQPSLLAVAAAATGRAPVLATGGGPDIVWWRIAGALLLCLLLAVGAVMVLRAKGGSLTVPWLARSGDNRLRVIERVALGPQSSLALVSVDGSELLVAAAPGGIAVVPLANVAGASGETAPQR